MGIEGFQKQFAESCRVGFYLRVLEEQATRSFVFAKRTCA